MEEENTELTRVSIPVTINILEGILLRERWV